jgi:pectate lyase
MKNPPALNRIVFALLALTTIACSSGGSSNPNPGTAGTTGAGGTGEGGSTAGGGATGSGGTPVVLTPMGTLLMDNFESGAGNWMVTQGTCSIKPDDAADGGTSNGSNVLNCINGGNEARAVGGMIGWGEYSLSAKVKVNAMDAGRRIYLAARYVDSSNWYGAAIYDGTPFEVQIRKKVAGTSSDIKRVPYDIVFGTWYTLKLEVKGATLKLYVNDTLQLEATDTQFASGQVALLVDRSDVSWDDVTVTNP